MGLQDPNSKLEVVASTPAETDADFLTEDEANRVGEAMLRGLKRVGRNDFTADDTLSVIRWANNARLRATLLKLVLEGKVDVIPSLDGDPKKVVFAA